MAEPRLIEFRTIHDPSGNLTPIENRDLPFEIARVFTLHDVPSGALRGGHSHYVLQEIIIATSGSFDVVTPTERFTLNRPNVGLYLPPHTWRHLEGFSSNAIALVLASTPYDEADYIR
jgi:hypothetical protein